MSERDDALAQAKLHLDVATLWRKLGLPGEPRRSCCCPFHDDKNESFSVYTGRNGRLQWRCFGSCAVGGGPVELLALALDIPEKEACRRLVEMAGTDTPEIRARERIWPAPKIPVGRRLVLPMGLRGGTPEELRQVAKLRCLSVAGLALASERGLLQFATPKPHGHPAWIVVDRSKVNAQARRMDGEKWEHIGGKKAWTLPGSRAPWPIGTREAISFPVVALVEGAPDLLAACHFIVAEGREKDVAAVAMLTATFPAGTCLGSVWQTLAAVFGLEMRVHEEQGALVLWLPNALAVGPRLNEDRILGLRLAMECARELLRRRGF